MGSDQPSKMRLVKGSTKVVSRPPLPNALALLKQSVKETTIKGHHALRRAAKLNPIPRDLPKDRNNK
jgi:hypothetical protein